MPDVAMRGVATFSTITGCDCCTGGGGTECTQCGPCDPVVADEFCCCITRVSLTKVDGDCNTFDLTLSPALCIAGSCSADAVVFPDFTGHSYAVGDGRTLTIQPSTGIVCFWAVDTYRVIFTCQSSLTGCTSFPTSVFQIAAITDDCDIDTLMGSYAASFLTPTSDLVKFFFTLSHTGSCP